MDTFVEELDNVIPLVRRVVDLLGPKVIAAASASLVDHLIANTAAAESFALGVSDLPIVKLLLGSQCRRL
jgi:hypothetical protein